MQVLCNGRGTCGCNGRCECRDPYLGDFCEFCSGDAICFTQTCNVNIGCAACAVEIFNQFPSISTTQFFTSNETLPNLPNGTTFVLDDASDTFQFHLPPNYCGGNCSQNIVLINGTDAVDYIIESKVVPCSYLNCRKIQLSYMHLIFYSASYAKYARLLCMYIYTVDNCI